MRCAGSVDGIRQVYILYQILEINSLLAPGAISNTSQVYMCATVTSL
jgi:hypothetical protein